MEDLQGLNQLEILNLSKMKSLLYLDPRIASECPNLKTLAVWKTSVPANIVSEIQNMGDWQHSDGSGDETEVHLWESDQGYKYQKQNIIKNIKTILKYVRIFYDTTSYAKLKQVNTQTKAKKKK